jgi:hypothetical protein
MCNGIYKLDYSRIGESDKKNKLIIKSDNPFPMELDIPISCHHQKPMKMGVKMKLKPKVSCKDLLDYFGCKWIKVRYDKNGWLEVLDIKY